jgi:hypothetical protein
MHINTSGKILEIFCAELGRIFRLLSTIFASGLPGGDDGEIIAHGTEESGKNIGLVRSEISCCGTGHGGGQNRQGTAVWHGKHLSAYIICKKKVIDIMGKFTLDKCPHSVIMTHALNVARQ